MQTSNTQANSAVIDAPRTATSRPAAPTGTGPPDQYREDVERTLRLFERVGIAVFPARRASKGTYVAGWPDITVANALSLTRAELARGHVNIAGRTGNGWAVVDLDDKAGACLEEIPRQKQTVKKSLNQGVDVRIESLLTAHSLPSGAK